MKRLFKWLIGLVITLALLLVLAVFLLPVFFDPNEHKPQIQTMAAETLGRDVQLNGPIEWSVFPWIAINLNDVVIDNEAGFKGDYLAQVETVAVRVKLLPLLSKKIQIGEVVLDQPSFRLQVAQSGNNNWQSIIDNLASGEPAAETESSTDLEVEGVNVNKGQLTYTDNGSDLKLQLTDFNFSSDAIKPGSPTRMSINAAVTEATNQIQGDFKAAWRADDLVGGNGMKLQFDELSLDGQMAAVPLSLKTSGNAVVDLAKDTMELERLQLNYGVMGLSTAVQGKQLTGNRVLSGDLDVEAFSLAELLAQMGSPLNNQANNELSGQAQWALLADQFKLDAVQFKLDDAVINGDVDIQRLSQLKGRFNLNIDSLNLDEYLPESEADASSNETNGSTSTSSGSLDLGQMSGEIKMGQLVAAGVKLSDIALKIRTQGSHIIVEPLTAGFYQGLINTELKLQPDKTTDKLRITHSMKDFQAGGLLNDLMGSEYLTGLGQLNADVKIDQPFSAKPLKTANGNISYRLSDGDIVGIDVFQIIQKSLSLLNKTEAQKSNAELKTAFGLMEIQADINNGVLSTNTLKLTSPYFDLRGDVQIDLDQQTIKGSIKPMLTNIPEGVLDKNFEKLINIRIPVELSGNLMEPSISIDIAKLLLASQQSKIDEKKEELKEDLFDAILGNKKDKKRENDQQEADGETPEMTEKQKEREEKDQLKRDLLEGLFKSSKNKKEPKGESEDGSGDDGN